MVSKLKSIVWFLKRPALYPQMLHLVKMKFYPDKEQEREAVKNWCESQVKTREEVLQAYLGPSEFTPIESLFPESFKQAYEAAEKCPVFMGGPGDLTLLYHLSAHQNAKYAIETGVAFGWSSLALLLGLSKDQESQLISIDMPYVQVDNDPYVGSVVPEALRTNWTLIRQADRQGLPKALKSVPYLNICHYDSDKSYYGRKWAYPKLWEALQPGGFFISDDIQDNWAFREFKAHVNRPCFIVEYDNKYVGIIRK